MRDSYIWTQKEESFYKSIVLWKEHQNGQRNKIFETLVFHQWHWFIVLRVHFLRANSFELYMYLFRNHFYKEFDILNKSIFNYQWNCIEPGLLSQPSWKSLLIQTMFFLKQIKSVANPKEWCYDKEELFLSV